MNRTKKSRANRAKTMRILIEGSAIMRNTAAKGDILDELNRLVEVDKINDNRRRWLLQVFHASRTLDTCLNTIVVECGLASSHQSLGNYLILLTNHSAGNSRRLPESSRKSYQKKIVDRRNAYMHKAGEYPAGESEVGQLLSEIDACLSELL